MAGGWRLGPYCYLPAGPGPAEPEGACRVVRRDGAGPRLLLQHWRPRPPARDFDALREAFLAGCAQAGPADPGRAHLGFDPDQAWCLQELRGAPLAEVWARAGRDGRRDLRARLEAALAGARGPRLLDPEAIGIEPGRVRLPRALADPGPAGPGELFAALDRIASRPAAGERAWPWAGPPDLGDGSGTPLRGRSRELTYLKSLVLGFGTRQPMDRVVLLLGEGGLGHGRLCDWAVAVAETEGLWVADLDARPGETPGELLDRILAELLAGLEAEFYAAQPAAARTLSRRLPAFAFLGGGGQAGPGPVAAGELAAALAAMAFAEARQPRLVVLRSLERTAPDTPGLVRELVAAAAVPWVIAAREPDPRSPGPGPGIQACLAALGARRGTAAIQLERLEDADLADHLGDRLGGHDLAEPFLARLTAAGLGNPGFLGRILVELQAGGALVHQDGRWTLAPGRAPVLEGRGAPGAGLLEARLGRLRPATRVAVRFLALAEEPLDRAVLGRALGLDGDQAVEALRPAVDARLVLVADGALRTASPRAAHLALAGAAPRERARLARDLLRALGGSGGSPLLRVRLLALGLERPAAMAGVLGVIAEARPGPAEAERILAEALPLAADADQQARLWQFLAEARTGFDILAAPRAEGLPDWNLAAAGTAAALPPRVEP